MPKRKRSIHHAYQPRQIFGAAGPLFERLEDRLFLSASSSAGATKILASSSAVVAKLKAPTQLSGNIIISGRTYNLSIEPYGSSKINPNLPTWLVIHGTDETPTSMNSVSSAIRSVQKGAQVLTLNWSSVADKTLNVDVFGLPIAVPNPFPVEDSVAAVGAWAEQALANAGFNLANLNIVGHSYGAYVGEEIAMDAPAGVNTIVALDPGQDVNNALVFNALQENLEQELPLFGIGTSAAAAYEAAKMAAGTPFFVNTLNFQTDTKNSWSFYADDSFGDAAEATTALQAISVFEPGLSNGPLLSVPFVTSLLGSGDQDDAHDDMVKIFANLINEAAKNKNQSSLFSLANMTDNAVEPWKIDGTSAGPPTSFHSNAIALVEPTQPFSAELITSSEGENLTTLLYIAESSGDLVTDKI